MTARSYGGLLLAFALCACPGSSSQEAGSSGGQVEPDAVKTVAALKVVPVTSKVPAALEAFSRGRTLDDNNRDSEALQDYKKALELDPDFAFAHAYLGYHTQGPGGLRSIARALQLAKPLPEPERLFIEYLCAIRQGEHLKAQELIQRLIRLAPDDWRVAFELGQQSFEQRKWALAVAAYKKSMTIIHTCTAYNNVAYAQSMQGRFDLGILALQKCIEMQPSEPNPRDSLGEIQLAAGHFEDAEASFRKALELDPKFYASWHGVASTRFFRDDWTAGYAALASSRAATLEATDRLEVDLITAWAQLAQGKGPDALQTLAAVEKEAHGLKESGAYASLWGEVTRSAILLELGKGEEALRASEDALERLPRAQLPGAISGALQRRAWLRSLLAQVALGRLDEAGRTLESLEAAQVQWADNPEIAAALHLARGAVRVGRKQWSEAALELSQCALSGVTEWNYDYRYKPEDVYCNWRLLEVQRHLGDLDGAAKTREALVKRFSREPVALYVQKKVSRPDQKHSPGGNEASSPPGKGD